MGCDGRFNASCNASSNGNATQVTRFVSEKLRLLDLNVSAVPSLAVLCMRVVWCAVAADSTPLYLVRAPPLSREVVSTLP